MDTAQTLLAAIHADPGDEMAYLALADALEEKGGADAAELLRLHLTLRAGKADPTGPEFLRLVQLLETGTRPVVPTKHNSLGMAFALIPPGRFIMGSPPEEVTRFPDEGPEHLVTITWPFYLGIFPVTQEEFTAVMGVHPSRFREHGDGEEHVRFLNTARHPVDSVSWEVAQALCVALGVRAGQAYRLPTEAEWEYACRAGISHAGPFHQGLTLSSHQANFDGREPFGDTAAGPYHRRTVPVDAYPPNAFGLFDMHGNISEWCSDWFSEDYYGVSPEADPRGFDMGERRVLRGGAWIDPGKYCRAAFRYDRPPEDARGDFGVRLVLEYPG